jgi:hypothetical protein
MSDSELVKDWTDIIPAGIKAPITIYKYRHHIQHWWKQLAVYCNKGETNIVILGRPSTGKSVLSSMLHGEGNEMSWKLPEISNTVESKAIRLGDWTKTVRVLPGQTSAERDLGMNEAFNKHENLEGVIYVVDWGYTQIRDEVTKKKMIIEDGITSIDLLRARNLEKELEDFKIVCDRIRESFAINKGPKWLLIAVNKADLYIDKLAEVEKYYHPKMNSDFAKILNNLLSKVGELKLKLAVIPVCSWQTPFEWNEEIVASNIGGEDNRRTLFVNMIKHISNMPTKN